MAASIDKSMDGRKKLGAWGERVAATHLEAKGYKIRERNWRCPNGEMDLIAEQDETIRFVEVKTRRGRNAGTPESAITPTKSKKLLHIALTYLGEYELDVDWQIDLIAVELDKNGKLLRCEHIENIVLAW